jgi:hypothetical protein
MSQLRYCYQNKTNNFQIIVVNQLERFLSPGMSVEFEARLEDSITVKDGYITAIRADNIPCRKLIPCK